MRCCRPVDVAPYTQEHYLVAASGVLPAIVAMLYFDWLDRKRPEPWGLRYAVTFLGMLSVIPTLVVGHLVDRALGDAVPPEGSYAGAAYMAFGIAAGIEEACKITAIFLVVWRSRAFDERMDGIVYGARAGLGFALVENCLYIYMAVIQEQWVIVWILRALLAVPGHAVWSGIMGYCAARSKFDRAGPGIVGGYLLAVLLHGAYDFVIFVGTPLRADGLDAAANALLLGPIVVSVIGWRIIRRMSRTALHLDDVAHARAAA